MPRPRNPGLAIAGLLIAVGSLLPWAPLGPGFSWSFSQNGLGGDGIITLGIGIVLLVAGMTPTLDRVRVGGAILSAFGLCLAIHNGLLMAKVDHASVGIGLWTIGVGGLMGAIVSLST